MKELLYFHALWCGPCRLQNPIIAHLKAEGYNIRSIDVDNDPHIAAEHHVSGVPSMIVLEDGKEIKRLVGVQSAETIKEALS